MKNSKKTKNMYKRVAAGALSMALVAGALPANVGGFLTGGNVLVAHAESYDLAVDKTQETNENEYGTVTRSYSGQMYHFNATAKSGYRFVNFTFAFLGTAREGSSASAGELNYLSDIVAHFEVISAPTVNAATELTYNGAAQALVTAPEGAAIHYRYKLSTAENWGDWSTDVPSATDAGEYVVQWYSETNSNYLASGTADDPQEGTVTISPLALTSENTALGWYDETNGFKSSTPYTGSPITPNVYYKTFNTTNQATYTLLGSGDYQLGDGNYSQTNRGDYAVGLTGKGNYAGDDILKSWSIAKADLTADDYTAPVGGTVSYTGEAVSLLTDDNKGSVATYTGTETPKGTFEYALGKVVSDNIGFADLAINDILKIGDGGSLSISNINSIVLSANTYQSNANNVITISDLGDYLYINNTEIAQTNDGGAAIKVTGIDREQGIVNAQLVGENTDLEWSTNVPNATNAGTYSVSWRIEGDANHNDTAPAFVTSAIEYATASLTLSPSLTGAVIVENGATEALEATDGVYTLAGTKKYNIYTNKSIADSTAATALDLTSKSSNKTFGGNTYSYRYEIEVPTTPAEGGYILSHTNNYVGKVSTEVGKANVMNIQEDGVTTENVAVLNADGVIYYGDQLEKDELVTIADGYGSIVNVDEIYLENNTASGGKVTGDALVIGTTYLLTAKVSVDADGDPDNGISGNTIYLKQQVTYAARPMNKNSYFLQTEDGLVPLEVSGSTVNVPAEYWVCTLKDDNSKTYIRVEEPDEAFNVLFTCTKKSTFVYNSAAQKPEIIVKNGGDNTIVLADTAVAANETATPPVAAVAKDYNNAAAEKTDAGIYSYALTAEANGKYSDSVTVSWSIAQADVSQYITVAPKNNVDTDGNKETLEAVVYDGAVLDSTDFEVKTNEAYTQLAADSPVKKLVDEFIDQLKAKEAVAADPANNVEAQPAVPAKTFVNVRGGQYEVTTDITYDSEISSSGVSINANSVGSYSNVILKGNLTFECSGGEFTEVKITCGEYVKSGSNSIQLTLDGNDIKCGADIVLTKNDNEWFKIVSITHGYGNETNEYTINLTTVPKTETRNETYDIKNAGNQAANVTVSNSNFKTVEFKQKLDNNGKPVEGEDNSVAVTIAKRDVTLTPDDDLSITYRDTVMPDLTYTIEDAKADDLTGVIAADKALFQKTTGEGADAVTTNTGAIYVDELVQEDTTAAAVNFVYALDENNATDYTTAGLNNAGSYKYAVINDAKFDNYNIVLPVDIAADEAQGIEEYIAPTFTVAPLNLNNIADLQIVLNGVTTGWTQNGNSGSYTYDGTTKAVEVKKVAKAAENTALSTVVIDSEWVRTESRNFAVEKEDVKLAYRSMNSNTGTITVSNDGHNDLNAILTANSGKVIKSVSFGIENFGRQNNAPLAEGTTAADIVSNEGGVFDPDTNKLIFNDIESDTFTLSAMNGYKLTISSVEITYGDDDVFVLSRDTDYTVGGATKRASAGTHEVQVMGKGNYTGVAKAPWQIVTAEAGEAALTLSGATTDSSGSYDYTKVYDGKAVTGAVTFTDPASDYAVDAEVEYKYYRGRYTKEQVTAADFNAAAIDAPVNAYYPNPAGDNYYPHAGEYTVVATITCDGYADQVLVKTVHIAPIDLTVNAAAKNMTYGDDLPAVTQADIDAIVGLTDDDSAYFQKFFTEGKLKFRYLQTGENTYDNNKIQIIPIISTEEEISAFRNVVYNYNTANFYWNVTEKAKSIKDSSIKVEFTEGDTIVLKADGTFASDNAIKVYDTAILGADGKATELVELGENNADTADYELTVESTATEGVYTLEIIGKNNYRGVRKIEFTAITAAKAATNLTFAEPYLKAGTTDKIILKNTATTDTEKYDIVKNGYVYYTGEGKPAKELLIENVDATLGIKVVGKAQAVYSPTLTDVGNGAYVRPYVIVKDK
ncbi:hypothetical protein SAMN02910265_03203, partial [Ruminococcus flavefaciens]